MSRLSWHFGKKLHMAWQHGECRNKKFGCECIPICTTPCPPFYYVRKVVRELWLRIVWCQRPSVGHALSNRRAPWSWSAAAEWCSHAPALHYPVTAQLPAPKTPQGDHWRSKLLEMAPQLIAALRSSDSSDSSDFVTIRTLIFSIHLIAKLIYIYIYLFIYNISYQ